MLKRLFGSWLAIIVLAIPVLAARGDVPAKNQDFGIDRFLSEYRAAIPRLAEQFNNYQLTIEQSFYWSDGSTQVREKLFAINGDRMMIRSLTKTDFISADEKSPSEKGELSIAVDTPGDCFRLWRESDSSRLQLEKFTKRNLIGNGVLGQTYIANAPFMVDELRSRVVNGNTWFEEDDWKGLSATSRQVGGVELVRVDWSRNVVNGKHYEGWWIFDRGNGWRLVESGGKSPEYGIENIIDVTYQEVDGRPAPKSVRDFVRFTADGTTQDSQREVVTAVTFDVPESVFDLNHYGLFDREAVKP